MLFDMDDTEARRAIIGVLKATLDLSSAVGHLAKASTIRDQEALKDMIQAVERATGHLQEVVTIFERKP